MLMKYLYQCNTSFAHHTRQSGTRWSSRPSGFRCAPPACLHGESFSDKL